MEVAPWWRKHKLHLRYPRLGIWHHIRSVDDRFKDVSKMLLNLP